MKKLIALSLTDVNNIEFRNLNEVDRWLKQFDNELEDSSRRLNVLKKLTAYCMKLPALAAKTFVVAPPAKKKRKGKIDPKTKVVVPRLRELTKNFDLLEDLFRQKDALDVIESKVVQSFSDDKSLNRIVKDIQKKRNAIDRAIKEARAFIDGLARKQIPQDFKSIGTFVFKRFLDSIEERYDSADRSLYINLFDDEEGDTRLQFTDVLHLVNFENGKGYVYPNWYVVVTYIASPNESSDMYISTEVEFTVPSREPRTTDSRGNKFRDKNHALKLLVADLELEGFVDALNEAPVPLEKNEIDKIFKTRDNIKKINVTETDIEFYLNKVDTATLNRIVSDILIDLKAAVEDTEFKRGIRYQIEKRGSNPVVLFNFRLPEPKNMQKVRINKTRLMEIKREFELTEEQTRRLYRLITAPKAYDDGE